VDAIVAIDATCGGAFRHELPDLFAMAEDDRLEEVLKLKAKVHDWAGFVLHTLDATFPPTRAPDMEVTVHDSCHMTHTEGRQESVRRLVERLPGVHVREMNEATICCGFGGSFSAMYPEEASRWQQRKLDNMLAEQVPVAIVSSPGCLTTLQERQTRDSVTGVRLMHPAELIVERCGWTGEGR